MPRSRRQGYGVIPELRDGKTRPNILSDARGRPCRASSPTRIERQAEKRAPTVIVLCGLILLLIDLAFVSALRSIAVVEKNGTDTLLEGTVPIDAEEARSNSAGNSSVSAEKLAFERGLRLGLLPCDEKQKVVSAGEEPMMADPELLVLVLEQCTGVSCPAMYASGVCASIACLCFLECGERLPGRVRGVARAVLAVGADIVHASKAAAAVIGHLLLAGSLWFSFAIATVRASKDTAAVIGEGFEPKARSAVDGCLDAKTNTAVMVTAADKKAKKRQAKRAKRKAKWKAQKEIGLSLASLVQPTHEERKDSDENEGGEEQQPLDENAKSDQKSDLKLKLKRGAWTRRVRLDDIALPIPLAEFRTILASVFKLDLPAPGNNGHGRWALLHCDDELGAVKVDSSAVLNSILQGANMTGTCARFEVVAQAPSSGGAISVETPETALDKAGRFNRHGSLHEHGDDGGDDEELAGQLGEEDHCSSKQANRRKHRSSWAGSRHFKAKRRTERQKAKRAAQREGQ